MWFQAVGNIGGSLMSLGQKEKKNIKKLASKVSNKVEKVGEKARKSLSTQHRYFLKILLNHTCPQMAVGYRQWTGDITYIGQGGEGEVVGQLSCIYETITTKILKKLKNFFI